MSSTEYYNARFNSAPFAHPAENAIENIVSAHRAICCMQDIMIDVSGEAHFNQDHIDSLGRASVALLGTVDAQLAVLSNFVRHQLLTSADNARSANSRVEAAEAQKAATDLPPRLSQGLDDILAQITAWREKGLGSTVAACLGASA